MSWWGWHLLFHSLLEGPSESTGFSSWHGLPQTQGSIETRVARLGHPTDQRGVGWQDEGSCSPGSMLWPSVQTSFCLWESLAIPDLSGWGSS